MALKLYYDLLSQPSRSLYMFFKICNIPFEKKIVNIKNMDHMTEEHQKIHPFKKVPAIEHNGLKLIESVGILRYICREYKVPDHWYPTNSRQQAKVDEYLEWHHLNTRIHCAMYFRVLFLTPMMTGKPARPEKVMQFEKRMNECLDLLENVWLKDKPFLVSDKISIADILCICELEQVRITGYNPQEGRPRLSTWMERVKQETTPHYQEAHGLLNKLAEMVKQKTPASML